MTKVITATEDIFIKPDGFKVFLAGAIDMGNAPNWQQEIIDKLDGISNLIIYNPRTEKFDNNSLNIDKQIIWELNALEHSNMVVVWFPKESYAPISFLEAGLYMRSKKIIIGVEDGFYRTRNLELTALAYSVFIVRTLDDLVLTIKKGVKSFTGGINLFTGENIDGN